MPNTFYQRSEGPFWLAFITFHFNLVSASNVSDPSKDEERARG
jgi:hypothetical protein